MKNLLFIFLIPFISCITINKYYPTEVKESVCTKQHVPDYWNSPKYWIVPTIQGIDNMPLFPTPSATTTIQIGKTCIPCQCSK